MNVSLLPLLIHSGIPVHDIIPLKVTLSHVALIDSIYRIPQSIILKVLYYLWSQWLLGKYKHSKKCRVPVRIYHTTHFSPHPAVLVCFVLKKQYCPQTQVVLSTEFLKIIAADWVINALLPSLSDILPIALVLVLLAACLSDSPSLNGRLSSATHQLAPLCQWLPSLSLSKIHSRQGLRIVC